MTDQLSSQEQLFEEEQRPSLDQEIKADSKRKRNSLGLKLPVNPPSGTNRPRTMSSQKAGDSSSSQGESKGKQGAGSQGRDGGTMLGLPGFTPVEAGSSVFTGKGADGQSISFNVFETVFTGRDVGAAQLERLLNYLHSAGNLDFSAFIEGISYQGFDRLLYIKAALKRVSVSQFCQFAVLGAVRGSNFQKIVDTCLTMPADLVSLVNGGIVVKTAKKREDLTILRFTASIPHWVAFWLFQNNTPKKIEREDCEGYLQFPGAASLPMGRKQRIAHISFCKAFSALLPGGSFNGNIYYTAYMNQIPKRDVPSMLKTQLGVGSDDTTSGVITDQEVREMVIDSGTGARR